MKQSGREPGRNFEPAGALICKTNDCACGGPRTAEEKFCHGAIAFRASPYLRHLRGAGTLPLDQISVGAVRNEVVVLYFHGGGYTAGGTDTHAGMVGRISKLSGLRVIVPTYRLAPEHPAPAAFENALTAYKALIAQGYAPNQVVFGGDSARVVWL